MRQPLRISYGIFALVVAIALPLSVHAITIDEIKAQINALMAQMAALQGQVQASAGTNASTSVVAQADVCRIDRLTLSRGASGTDVSKLQAFLIAQGHLSANATGFFGPATAAALAQFQLRNGIISSLASGGNFGPATRLFVRTKWCTAAPQCKPLDYVPAACPDGSQPFSTRDQGGCVTGYACAATGFLPPPYCQAWNDGCNECTRPTASSTPVCTKRACFASDQSLWAGKGYCSIYFAQNDTNSSPIITSVAGPLSMQPGQQGLWSIIATDRDNASLTYSVKWGDEKVYGALPSGDVTVDVAQKATFTHSYSAAGVYQINFVVSDPSGGSSQNSITIKVGGENTICGEEYAPVCGQPPEPACRSSIPACMVMTPGPQTYSNKCFMGVAGATLINEGVCKTGGYACTADAKQCPDGSYVGRTGPNCSFAACPTVPTTCTTPWGSIAQNGQTAQGFCADNAPQGSACVLTKVCFAGEWSFQAGDPAANPNCKAWSGNCSSCTRSTKGGTPNCNIAQCQNGGTQAFCSAYF